MSAVNNNNTLETDSYINSTSIIINSTTRALWKLLHHQYGVILSSTSVSTTDSLAVTTTIGSFPYSSSNSTAIYAEDGSICPSLSGDGEVDWLRPQSLASLAVLLTIDLLVILGNCLVIAAVFCSSKLRSVTNLFIVSLAVADLMVGIAVLPFSATWEVFKVWIFGTFWCRAWLALDVWMCTASILNLCAISLDRYVAVTRPVAYPSIMSAGRAKALIAGLWVLSFVICFPPLVGWKDKKEGEDLIDISSCPWTCELTNDAGYVVYSALGSFYIPMFVMLFFYWRIYRAAVRTTRAINQGFRTTKGSRGIGRFEEQRLTLRIHRGRASENRRCRQHQSSISSNTSGVAGHLTASPSMRNCSPQHSSPRSASTSLGSGGGAGGNVNNTAACGNLSSPERATRTSNWVLNSGPTTNATTVSQLDALSASPLTYGSRSNMSRSLRTTATTKRERVQISVQYPSAERLNEPDCSVATGGVGIANSALYAVHYSVSDGSNNSGSNYTNHQQQSQQQHGVSCQSLLLLDNIGSHPGVNGSMTTSGNNFSAGVNSSQVGLPHHQVTDTLQQDCLHSQQHCQLNSSVLHRAANNIDVASGHLLRVTSQQQQQAVTSSTPRSVTSQQQPQHNFRRRSSSLDSRDIAACAHRSCQTPSPSPTRRMLATPGGVGGVGGLYREDCELSAAAAAKYQVQQQHQQNRKMGKRNIKAQVKRFRMETKAAKTLAIIVGGFIVCWFPFFTMYVIRAFCADCIHPLLFSVLFWLGYCNSAINPLIYALFSKDFREAFTRIICRYCFCCGRRRERNASTNSGGGRDSRNNNATSGAGVNFGTSGGGVSRGSFYGGASFFGGSRRGSEVSQLKSGFSRFNSSFCSRKNSHCNTNTPTSATAVVVGNNVEIRSGESTMLDER